MATIHDEELRHVLASKADSLRHSSGYDKSNLLPQAVPCAGPTASKSTKSPPPREPTTQAAYAWVRTGRPQFRDEPLQRRTRRLRMVGFRQSSAIGLLRRATGSEKGAQITENAASPL